MASKKKKSLCLVIDANVARSAGPENATHPTSKSCRDVLLAVEKHGFCIVSTADLREEWNRHQSGFFRLWRVQMMARKRITALPVSADTILRNKLKACPSSEKDCEAMLKDVHLLEAALASDNRIISCERVVRILFAHACSTVSEIRHILWAKPDNEEEKVIGWLEKGTPDEDHRRLENYLKSASP